MAYDEELAERVREQLADVPDLVERKMFGGLAFMAAGNMVCGVLGDELIVRLGPEGGPAALARPHARPMTFTGRPMRAMVVVGAEGLAGDAELAGWVADARAFVATLPPRAPGERRRRAHPPAGGRA